jgi:hypothetical protein
MILEVWNFNCLINHQLLDLTGLWMIISNSSTDSAKFLASVFPVITVDTSRSPVIMNSQDFLSNNQSVCMTITFNPRLTINRGACCLNTNGINGSKRYGAIGSRRLTTGWHSAWPQSALSCLLLRQSRVVPVTTRCLLRFIIRYFHIRSLLNFALQPCNKGFKCRIFGL